MLNDELKRLYEEACTLIEKRQYQDAKNVLVKILEEDRKNYLAMNKLGIVHANLTQFEEAKTCFDTVLLHNPDYAPAIVNLGNIFLEAGDLQNAEAQYKLAIEKDEDYHLSYNNLAVIYKRQGQYSKYIRNIKKHNRLNKQHLNQIERVEAQRIKQHSVYITTVIIALIISVAILLPMLY